MIKNEGKWLHFELMRLVIGVTKPPFRPLRVHLPSWEGVNFVIRNYSAPSTTLCVVPLPRKRGRRRNNS